MNIAQETVKQARLLHLVFLVTIGLYAFTGEKIARHEAEPGALKVFQFAFLAVAAFNIFLSSSFRKKLIEPALETLLRNPEDGEALKKWQSGNMLTFCFCEVVGVLGLVLRFLGGTLIEAAIFYVVAAAALILWAPRGEFAGQT